MAENKKSFLLYADLKHTLKKLPDEKAGQLFKHILSYVNDENPETDDLIIEIAFEPIKQQLKRDLKKWGQYIDKQRENGKLGGRPPKPKETQKTQPFISKPKKPVNVNVSVNDNVDDNVIVNEIKEKTIPETSSGLKKKPTKKKKKIVNPLFAPFKDLFEKYYNQISETEYYWMPKDSVATNKLIAQVKHAYVSTGNENPSDDEMLAGYEGILKRAAKDKWFNQNFETSIISSKFNNLKSKGNDTTKNAIQSVAESISREGAQFGEEPE